MNTEKYALFLYSLQILIGEKFNQKNVVFKLNNRFLTAELYESNPFEESVNKRKFRSSFFDDFIGVDPFNETKEHLKNDLSSTFRELEKFVLNSKVKVSDNDLVLRNVTFLDMPETNFPFLLIGSKESLQAVSFISDETQD